MTPETTLSACCKAPIETLYGEGHVDEGCIGYRCKKCHKPAPAPRQEGQVEVESLVKLPPSEYPEMQEMITDMMMCQEGQTEGEKQTFSQWLNNHPCSTETIWHIQNCLGSTLGYEHPLTKEVVEAWENSRKTSLQEK